jgi:hypothetical protein
LRLNSFHVHSIGIRSIALLARHDIELLAWRPKGFIEIALHVRIDVDGPMLVQGRAPLSAPVAFDEPVTGPLGVALMIASLTRGELPAQDDHLYVAHRLAFALWRPALLAWQAV